MLTPSLEQLTKTLPAKSLDELSFWLPIARNGFRGFSAAEFRTAAIHYKQYGLIQIGRDIGYLKNKTVLELCCGPTPIVCNSGASRAIGVDPLNDVYAALWDRSNDGVEYITTEIEKLTVDLVADIVICWNGIDHVRDIEKTMAKIDVILKRDGELWTFTNTEDNSISLNYKKNEDEGHQHQYAFNCLSLDRFFQSHDYYWVTKFTYEPMMGEVYPYSGVGGVLKKRANSKRSISRDMIRASVRQLLYSNFGKKLWR